MKKQIVTVTLLSVCAATAHAQIKMPGTISGGLTDAVPANATSIVIGTGATAPATNVLIGKWTGSSLTSGDANTFLGYGTGNITTTGNNNTFVGASVAPNNIGGHSNAFFGAFSGQWNSSGFANTFLGVSTGSANTSGQYNTFVGQGCGNQNVTGNKNVFVGHDAGNGSQGSDNTALGAHTSFSPSTIQKATVIGRGAQATSSNTMILGGGYAGTDAVRVGIGESPAATEHILATSAVPENVNFKTTSTATNSASTLHLTSSIYTRLAAKNYTYSGNFLNAITGQAPAIQNANQATLLTNGTSLAIGTEGGEGGNILFVNRVQSASTGSFDLAECLHIHKGNGFVGVNTRTAVTGGGTGDPQAMFHVNLTNPIVSLNTLTQGIRFEGLPNATAAHTKSVLIDVNGNLAVGTGTTTPSNAWLLNGNTTTGAEFIGTLTSDDFRIKTNNVQRARVTADGNFDFGSNSFTSSATTSGAIGTTNTVSGSASSFAVGANNLVQTSNNSAAFGNDNTIDASAVSVLAAGYDNLVKGSVNSVAFGEANTILSGSTASSTSQATGFGNSIKASGASLAAGRSNVIDVADAAFAAGNGVNITSSQMVAGLGGNITITNSNESVAAGEDLQMINAHGCFVAGGHNFSDGAYNVLLGHELAAQTTPATMSTSVQPTTSFMLLGEQIHNNLPHSLVMGFNGNRAMVIDNRGVAVKLDATNTSTYAPTVNFEVDAGISGAGPQSISSVRSNLRFHNLPVATDPLPAVVIDPATGEVFQTASQTYQKQNSDVDLYEENEKLKADVAELRSQLSAYDEKFARLESAIHQICENGCGGLNSKLGDALYQSIPNPSDDNVTINYFLSRSYNEANISLYSLDGKILNSFHVSPGKGNGSINIRVGELQPGMYMYKLVVDGKEAGAMKLHKQ